MRVQFTDFRDAEHHPVRGVVSKTLIKYTCPFDLRRLDSHDVGHHRRHRAVHHPQQVEQGERAAHPGDGVDPAEDRRQERLGGRIEISSRTDSGTGRTRTAAAAARARLRGRPEAA